MSHALQPFETATAIRSGSVQLGLNFYPWETWNGQQLGRKIAIDTETTLIDRVEVPKLCMVSISDGSRHYVAKPSQLAQFLTQHLSLGHELAMHNVAFDFWVMDRYLTESAEIEARSWLWTAVDQHRIHDTMLLSALITLARADDDRMLSLADAVKRWCGFELDKDGYRVRYGEIVSSDWKSIDDGFFRYAVCDAIATWHLFAKLLGEATSIVQQHQLPVKFGLLTEAIQVKAAVSLAAISRHGLHVDLERVTTLRHRIDTEIRHHIRVMQDLDPNLWHRYKKSGELKTTKATGLPRLNRGTLINHFERIAAKHLLEIPKTPTGKMSTSVNHCWLPFRKLEPLVDAYCGYTESTKLRTFFDGLREPRIHPKYRTMVRSGRTSCYGPNIQQLPSSSPVREAITARPGHRLFIIDYNSLELRTLATVCHQQFGFSRLRDVLVEGIDPHSYTAAMFAGVGLEAFNVMPEKKQLRQRAKVFNFGLPAGFGAAALVDHAKFSYGVDLSLAEAEEFIRLLTQRVYPELGLFLSDDSTTRLAKKLQADSVQVRATWPHPYSMGMLRKILEGAPVKSDGTPYQPITIERMWLQLESLCSDPELMPHILARNTTAYSPLRKLLHESVSTLTGRVRGDVSFTASKNTPFQGLAADGCKQAMWDLTKAGYRIVAFIHDEFIIELNESVDFDHAAAEISRICSESMQPFVPGIPVPCEFALCERWHKGAEAVYDENDRLQVWLPPGETH